jgi:hypothetical protein
MREQLNDGLVVQLRGFGFKLLPRRRVEMGRGDWVAGSSEILRGEQDLEGEGGPSGMCAWGKR